MRAIRSTQLLSHKIRFGGVQYYQTHTEFTNIHAIFFNEMQMLVFILDVCSLCTDISLQKGKVFICKIDIGLQSIISVFYAQHRVILSSSSYQYHFHVFEIACYT